MKTIPALFILLIVLNGCRKVPKGELILADVSKDTVFTIHFDRPYVTGMNIRIIGAVNDTFILASFTKLPGGAIDTLMYADTYSSPTSISYTAYKATKGQLKFRYEIR